MPQPINSCTFSIEEDFITISRPAGDNESYPTMVAKARTPEVLAKLMGQTTTTMPTEFGILPRGTRYISADRTMFAIEYPPSQVSLMLPPWLGRDVNERIIKVWLPKHFICVKFDNEFANIQGAAIALSYGYNYTMDDRVQTLFTMKNFEFPLVPTTKLSDTFKSVGAFLSTLRDRILMHAFSILPEDAIECISGDSLPFQYDGEKDGDFFEWWASQGELVSEWTFDNPRRSTLSEIMHLNDSSGSGLPDFGSLSYTQIIDLLIQTVSALDILPQEQERMRAKAELSKGWREWRKTYKPTDGVVVPANYDWLDDLLMASA